MWGSQGFKSTNCTVSASQVCVCRGSLPAFLAAGGTLLGCFHVFFSHHGLVMKKITWQGFVAKASWCVGLARNGWFCFPERRRKGGERVLSAGSHPHGEVPSLRRPSSFRKQSAAWERSKPFCVLQQSVEFTAPWGLLRPLEHIPSASYSQGSVSSVPAQCRQGNGGHCLLCPCPCRRSGDAGTGWVLTSGFDRGQNALTDAVLWVGCRSKGGANL